MFYAMYRYLLPVAFPAAGHWTPATTIPRSGEAEARLPHDSYSQLFPEHGLSCRSAWHRYHKEISPLNIYYPYNMPCIYTSAQKAWQLTIVYYWNLHSFQPHSNYLDLHLEPKAPSHMSYLQWICIHFASSLHRNSIKHADCWQEAVTRCPAVSRECVCVCVPLKCRPLPTDWGFPGHLPGLQTLT